MCVCGGGGGLLGGMVQSGRLNTKHCALHPETREKQEKVSTHTLIGIDPQAALEPVRCLYHSATAAPCEKKEVIISISVTGRGGGGKREARGRGTGGGGDVGRRMMMEGRIETWSSGCQSDTI